MQPDLSGNPFFAKLKFQLNLNTSCKKRLGTEGINEVKAKAFIEIYERSS
ncbi:MAG: hypothetical protein RR305_18615 [Chryseobacterium sp.]